MPPSNEKRDVADQHLRRLLEDIERDEWPKRPDHVDPLDSTRASGGAEPSPQPPQMPRAGAVVHDSWELSQVLGKGAFGLVFRARHRQLERDDAVKFLHPHLADDRDLRSRFLQEAKIMARVHGEHLVHVHDCGEHERLPFFVMERLQGETLQERLRRDGPLPIESVRALAVGILRGLGEVHSQDIIHRDVKPANIFVLEGSDRVKLLDFGLAMTSLRMTATGTILGTPLYMAPELLGSPDARASVATDIYSAGAVLYQVLTGHAPFEPGEGGTIEDFVRRLGATDLKSPRQVRPEVPETIEGLVLRMLDRDPDARPTKADALADEIDRVLGAPPSEPSAVVKTRSRGISRWVVGAMGVVLIILGVAVGYTWPWGAAPTLTDSDGILVTAPWWASTEVEESFEAACEALTTRAPRRVACARASSWTMEDSHFREWALASGAAIVVRFETAGEAKIVLGEGLDGVPLLAELPRLRANELERIADLTSLLTVLPWSLGDAHFDVPTIDVETVGYRWATVAALLHRLHGEDPEAVLTEHLQELARCDGARPDVLEDERLCDIARYLALTADRSSTVVCGGRLQPELEELTSSESIFVASSSQVLVAKCMVSEQPKQTAALVLGALDAIPQPHGCETLAAFELEPSLVGGSEAEQRLLGRIAAVDPRQCNALVAAHAIGKRAYARLESERVAEAAQDYYLAYSLDPGEELHLVNWADTLLLQSLDEVSPELLLAELRLDLMPHPETDEDHQIAFAIALFRWLVDRSPATAEEILRRYDRMPTEVQPLMRGLGNGLHETLDDVLHTGPSERNRAVLEEWLRLRPD